MARAAEQERQETGEHIRPILLFQAEPHHQDRPDALTVEVLEKALREEEFSLPDAPAFGTAELQMRLARKLRGSMIRAVTAAPTIASEPAPGAIPEHSLVRLCRDLAEAGLQKGSKGAVVHAYEDGSEVEVEFVTGDGETRLATVAVQDLEVVSVA